MRPYRVMVNLNYAYVGYDIDKAIGVFKALTDDQAAGYVGDVHSVSAEPMIHAIDNTGMLIASLYNVGRAQFEERNRPQLH